MPLNHTIKQSQEIQATLSTLSKQQEAILKALTEKTGSGSGEGGGSGSTFNTNGADSRNNRSLQIGKIDFPKFSGDDVEGWVYRCEHFFAMDETPEGMILRYAVVHLEGDTLQWHRANLRTRNATVAEIQWDEYVRSISAHFSNAMFEDPLEELAFLNQTSTLHDLNTAFDALLNKVNLTKSQAISLYLKDLSLDIRGMVKMFRPRTLLEAYGLAKTQDLNNESLEEKINKEKGNSGNTRNYSNFNITPPINASKLPLLPTLKPAKTTFTKPNGGPRRLTSKELEYKRAKGECFWCTKKFVPGHKCPRNRNQVYVIEMEDDDDEETEEIGAETKEKEHQISIHALTGLPSYSTMRVQGFVGNRQLHILIDSAKKVEELLGKHSKGEDLWNICKQYGQVVDAFIPDRKSKANKRYRFIRFIRVYDVDHFVSNLCTLWMRSHHLHANVARFQRPPAVNSGGYTHQNGNYMPKKTEANSNNGSRTVKMSYVNIVNGDTKSIEACKPAFLLDESCLNQLHYSLGLFGKVKEFSSFDNMRMVPWNEGFNDIDLRYMG
nr:uncharacterized protein [Tanacetum cinerariifolium]